MEIGPKNTLYVRRGDSHGLWISATDPAGEFIPFEPGDVVRLTIKSTSYDATPELQLVVTEFDEGKAHFVFEPGMTKPLSFGEYVYDVEVTRSSGWVDTIIPKKDKDPPAQCIITEEVT